jgi:hypothetical protein
MLRTSCGFVVGSPDLIRTGTDAREPSTNPQTSFVRIMSRIELISRSTCAELAEAWRIIAKVAEVCRLP